VSDWLTPNVIYFAGLAVLLSLLLAERWRHPQRFNHADTLTNAAMYAGYVVVGALWAGTLYALYRLAWDHRLFDLGPWWLAPSSWQFWACWGALLVLEDFCFYWFHRSSHALPVFWASHVTHHSSPYFNFSTALRQSWIPFHTFVFWMPLPLLGFDPLMVITMQLSNLFFQSLQHTTFNNLPRWYTFVFNAPQHHRVHHACNPELVDRNFAGIFILWDRLFGTFAKAEDARDPVRFGIESPPASANLLWLEVHGWFEWFRQLAVRFSRRGAGQ
jgi:sterol desaturase/sphingolipid hydroxylase (fatty acid hydroxylase superfamily)